MKPIKSDEKETDFSATPASKNFDSKCSANPLYDLHHTAALMMSMVIIAALFCKSKLHSGAYYAKFGVKSREKTNP